MDKHENYQTGQYSISSKDWTLADSDVEKISRYITNKVNDELHERGISKEVGSVNEDLIREHFKQIHDKTNYVFQHLHDVPSIFSYVASKTIDVITRAAVATYVDEQKQLTYSIWNSVGKQTPFTLKAINKSSSNFGENIRY